MVKISTFMIGMVIVSMFAGLFGVVLADMSGTYGVADPSDDIKVYNQLDNLTADIEEIQDQTTEIKTQTGVLDIIGGYFQDAYNVLVMTKNSFSVFETMTTAAIEKANIGAAGKFFRIGIISIVLILIFVGVLISAILKKDV